MKYKGEHTREISFPLGGIGTGSIGLAGNGRLIDWEIFNRPDKGSLNGLTHFSIRAVRDGRVVDARVLMGDLQPPYVGIPELNDSLFVGYGWGPRNETLCGLLHFRNHTFTGEFPIAKITFADPDSPVAAKLTAWSPFIPSNAEDSSKPLAYLEWELENHSAEPLELTLAGVLSNPCREAGAHNRVTADGKLRRLELISARAKDDFAYSELALTTDSPNAYGQSYFYRGGWYDALETYYHELNSPERYPERTDETRKEGCITGLLATEFKLGPGEKQTVRFALSWHVPNRCNDFSRGADIAADGIPNRWKNYYATRQESAAEAGTFAFAEYERLRRDTFRFHDLLFRSSLPAAVLDGVTANLAVLRSPVTLRLEDGTFYGWEGAGNRRGSCDGSCSHVWNYAQALPFLFPELERTMRDAQYFYNVDSRGGAHFRLKLPLGRKAKNTDFRPCVDGTFGEVMKTYREWKISGRTDWLRKIYPILKRTIEFAWSPENPDRWDPEQSGVLTGRQHNTLDIEFFGPNGYLNAHYLGALKAAAEIADAADDPVFAETCRKMFRNGKKWTDKNLFNGEFYYQQVTLEDRAQLAAYPDADNYWNCEAGQVKYQFARGGCAIDAPLAQFYATLYGIGEVLDPERTAKNLDSIYRYNFKNMRTTSNTWRNYCVNDESNVVLCTWPYPEQPRPVIPACYSTESFTGQEWAFAAGLAQNGMGERATAVARAIRDRYDGRKRNPWSEIECGSNYARSMSSYALLPVWSGFRFDLTRGMIGFNPIAGGNAQYFWSVDGAWGEWRQTVGGARTLELAFGKLHLRELRVAAATAEIRLNRHKVEFISTPDGVEFPVPLELKAGDRLTLSRP